ncbi:hypothetical protein GGR53DRAFT_7451 [Hypoxylon sp. FL1150]|nr:hypothetical protein GGR53DRAFT_7451 [Hypoxylon sp. FL1150]
MSSYRLQNYGILIEGPVHRSSSNQLPPTLVSDDSYYRSQPPYTEGHNASYASYASYSTMASTRTSEDLMGYQAQPMPCAQVPSNSHYAVRGHNPADVNIGSSGGTSFSTHTTNPFELPYYQAVAPESRPVESADMYHHQYPQGYGSVVTSPPSTSSKPAGSSHRKQKHNASRSRKPPRNNNNNNNNSQQQVFSPGSTSSTSNNASSRSRLRSASRTSKNTHHNPPASAEEQKSRETHNQVEKQYRNRLNAHFESLLDALPDTMQAGEGEGEENEGGGGEAARALDLTDRRVSKAEVLDMARRHIQALERECAALEGERDELRNNMARLRWLFGRCEGADGFNERLGFPDTGPLP